MMIALCVSLGRLRAQDYSIESNVMSASGDWSTNHAHHVISAVGNGQPVGVFTNDLFVHYAGFLGTFLMHPDADVDQDGLPDENDPDDDGDGISDLAELRGVAFSPTMRTNPLMADSDGDGYDDDREILAGTNPMDPNSVLRITDISHSNGQDRITWHAIKFKTYEIVRYDSMSDMTNTPSVVHLGAAFAGDGAWNEGVMSSPAINVPSGLTNRYYEVRMVLD